MTHGNCSKHEYRKSAECVRSIGRVIIETCNNCLSVMVVAKRDTDDVATRTEVEMKDSAYLYVK